MIRRAWLSVLTVLFITASPAWATTYYVATTGSDSNSGLTTAAPFLTIRHGVSVLHQGDTLYIRGGTYTGETNSISDDLATVPSGTSGGRIVISGYPSETVIIRPADNGNASAIALHSASHSYLTFQDLVIDGSTSTVLSEPSSAIVLLENSQTNIILQRIEIKDCWYSGVNDYSTGSNQWLYVTVHGCGRRPESPGFAGTSGDGFYVLSSDSVFDHLNVYNNHGYGFYLNQDRNILRNSSIHDNGTTILGPGQTLDVNYGVDIGAGAYPSSANNLVYNNLIYNNRGGIQVYTHSANTGIYNNTLYGNGPSPAVAVQYIGGDVTFRNNIIYGNTDNRIVDYGGFSGGTIVQDHNLFANPSFTSAASGDFTLGRLSVARDTGTAISSFSTDYLGTARPQNTVWDIGAYEYSTGYAFSMATSGPTHVGRGHALYRLLDLVLLVGPRDYVVYSVTGLPSGVTASFPDLEATCCGPLTQYEPASTALKLAANASATTGSFTLTVTAVSGGVSHNVTTTIVVDAVPAALSFTPIASYTAIPSLATWVSHMTAYGATHCATLQDAMADADLKLGATYYDAERVYYQIATYTGNTATWNPCAAAAEAAYRDYYVIPNGGGLAGYWNFTKGLRMDFERTGDTTSKTAALSLSQNAAFASSGASAYSKVLPAASREVAYAALSYINTEQIGYTRNAKLDEDLDIMLGHMDQWFVSMNYRCPNVASYCTQATVGDFYLAPFMVGLTMDALIDYYQEISPDPRIPVAIKTAVDWLWTHAWYAPYQLFWLDNWIANPATIPAGYWAPSIAPGTEADLNLLIAPAYAWLYRLTGDTTYRDEGDAVFAGGVATAFLAGGKQFNQNYKWSFDYVSWRSGAAAVPTSIGPVRLRFR